MKTKKPISTGAVLGWLFGIGCAIPVIVTLWLYVAVIATIGSATVNFTTAHHLEKPALGFMGLLAALATWSFAAGFWAWLSAGLHFVAMIWLFLFIIGLITGGAPGGGGGGKK